jgi:hypothetical protein
VRDFEILVVCLTGIPMIIATHLSWYKLKKWLKTFQTILDCYSVILEQFYMVNPTPHVIKTIANEVKN